MPEDIVDLDTQNNLTVPVPDIKPYPLSQNDRVPDASKIEVPTQEPVVTDMATPVIKTLDDINKAINSDAYVEKQREELEPEQETQEPVLNEQKQPKNTEKPFVREETAEEQYKRLMGEFEQNRPEYSFYIPETNKVIKTNQKDFDKAKFDYLSFKMRQEYLHNTHNYADYGQNLQTVGNNQLKTVAMLAASVISTMKVDSPADMLSLAPTRVNMRSTTPMRALSAGT